MLILNQRNCLSSPLHPTILTAHSPAQELSSEELLRYLSTEVGKLGSGCGAAVLVRDVLRLADRDGTGTVGRKEWVRAYSAVKELLRDGEGVEL